MATDVTCALHPPSIHQERSSVEGAVLFVQPRQPAWQGSRSAVFTGQQAGNPAQDGSPGHSSGGSCCNGAGSSAADEAKPQKEGEGREKLLVAAILQCGRVSHFHCIQQQKQFGSAPLGLACWRHAVLACVLNCPAGPGAPSMLHAALKWFCPALRFLLFCRQQPVGSPSKHSCLDLEQDVMAACKAGPKQPLALQSCRPLPCNFMLPRCPAPICRPLVLQNVPCVMGCVLQVAVPHFRPRSQEAAAPLEAVPRRRSGHVIQTCMAAEAERTWGQVPLPSGESRMLPSPTAWIGPAGGSSWLIRQNLPAAVMTSGCVCVPDTAKLTQTCTHTCRAQHHTVGTRCNACSGPLLARMCQ